MRLIPTVAVCVLLAACGRERADLKPDLPPAGAVVAPQLVVVEKRVYVPIDARLTQPEPVAEGPIGQCFEVAARRRSAIAKLNSKLAEIAAIQGTEVEQP